MAQKLPEQWSILDGFGQRKVTIYLGTKKYEASWLEVSIGPYAQYADAFHIKIKPKGARRIRSYVEDWRPNFVIVDGWGHPEFDWLLRGLEEAPEEQLAPGVTIKTLTETIRRGQQLPKNKYELEFEQYIASLEPSRILLDTRGKEIKTRW